MAKVPPIIYGGLLGIVISAATMYQLGTPNGRDVYTAQSVTYSNSSVNGNRQTYPLGDHSNDQGGRAPAYLKEKPVIPTPEGIQGWYTTGSNAAYDGNEAKFRTHCNFSHLAYDDPILFPGQPGVSHLHMFFGNTGTNANSTYYSLRTTGQSTCMGGILNRTAYWHPAVLKDDAIGDGKTMAVKPDMMVVYYTVGASAVAKGSPLPRGFNYITGFNPADPTNSRATAEVAAATGTFALGDSGDGFVGWHCEGTNGPNKTAAVAGDYQPYLANADGTPTLDCASGTRIYAEIEAAACWDGVNLSSPDGRAHVRDFVKDVNVGNIQVCPVGWYRLPRLKITFWFSHLGSADYKLWYLSSDRFNAATFKNGESFHTDWFGAWDPDIMKTWLLNCTGTAMPGETTNPNTCGDSLIGDGRKLLTSSFGPNGYHPPHANSATTGYVETGARWTDYGNSRFLALPGQ